MARHGTGRSAEPEIRARGASRADRWVSFVLCAAVGTLLTAGCSGLAWQGGGYGTGSYELPRERAVAALPLDALAPLAATNGGAREVIEGTVPRFEIFGGVMPKIVIGHKIAGHDGTAPPNTNVVYWNDAYEGNFSFDVVVNLSRPARSAIGLAAGDTFLGVRVSIENYGGLDIDDGPGGALGIETYDDMTLFGVWADGRTLLNPLDAARRLRPYLHYGAGVVTYPEVTITNGSGVCWDATLALGWHMGIGIEFRAGRLGAYVEGGIQAVGPPDVAETYALDADIDQRTAHTFLTYPIRVGVMVAF